MRHETSWLLFLDETGDFDDPAAAVAIAGLLVQETHPAMLAGLRAPIAALNPVVPYPPHASMLNLSLAHWVAWSRAAPAARAAHWRADWMATADRELAGSTWLAKVLATPLQRGNEWYAALQQIDAMLPSRAPGAARLLEAVRGEHEHRMVSFLDALAGRYGPERCLAVAAAEAPGIDGGGSDRYLSLLRVVMERVLLLLRSRPAARHRVRVLAAGRHVEASPFPRRIDLRSRDVADAIRAAERFPLDAPPAGGPDAWVHLVPESPQPYDAQVHPCLVLADFVANRLGWPLRRCSSWPALSDDVRRRTALPAEAAPRWLAPARPCPTIAAAGPAGEVVRALFGGELDRGGALQSLRDRKVRPGWAREQAERWIDVAPASPAIVEAVR